MVEFVELFKEAWTSGKSPRFFLSLVVVGIVLILVNTFSDYLIRSREERRRQFKLVTSHLKPVLSATSDVISRICEIIVTQRPHTLGAIARYDPLKHEERVVQISQFTMNRHESTAYRLIRLLGLSNQFLHKTAGTPSFPLLDRAEYFLKHKMAAGLRGNLYGISFISRELQLEMATVFDKSQERDVARELSIGEFCDLVKKDEFARHSYKLALDLFAVDCTPLITNKPVDRNDENWKHILALAHLCVNLIDMDQTLGGHAQWEEYRVFLVRLIRQWNSDLQQPLYFYQIGDAKPEKSYLDTYPGNVTSLSTIAAILAKIPGWTRCRGMFERIGKYFRLNIRGIRYGRRHSTKRLNRKGVKVYADKEWEEFNLDMDIRPLHEKLKRFLERRMANPGEGLQPSGESRKNGNRARAARRRPREGKGTPVES